MGHPSRFAPDFCGELLNETSSPQRTHNRRSRSTLAAANDCGSRVSLASMRAQYSPRRVAAAKAASITLVRPEEAGPQSSVRHPRGRPPVRASSAAMPLLTISGAGRISSREAGVMLAGGNFRPLIVDRRLSVELRSTGQPLRLRSGQACAAVPR